MNFKKKINVCVFFKLCMSKSEKSETRCKMAIESGQIASGKIEFNEACPPLK